MKIGNKLKTLRVNKGYSSELVAEKIGIALITYRRYERDESVPNLNMLEKIASTYEIPITALFANENIVLKTGQDRVTYSDAIIINQLSDMLIEQYEIRLREKDEIIANQKIKLNQNK